MLAGCLYVADANNKRIQVVTLCGRFVRYFDVSYCPGNLAVRPDGKLLVSGQYGERVELTTLFGSLLQVRLSHAHAARILRIAPVSSALVLAQAKGQPVHGGVRRPGVFFGLTHLCATSASALLSPCQYVS